MYLIALVVALVFALTALWFAVRTRGKIEDLSREQDSLRRQLADFQTEAQQRMEQSGRLLLRASQGKPVSAAQALEGRMYDEIDGQLAWRLLETHRGVTILDVRDPHEYAAGHIPGVLWIPLNQLEQRWEEVPREADYVIIHCAAGSRSAAACEYLSREHGYLNLYNLSRGLPDWPGPLEAGRPT